MMNYGYSNDYGWVIWLILGILVIAVAAYAFMRMDRNRDGRDGRYPPRHEGNDAMDTLKRRYANGEISEEEFERMRKQLENRP